MSTPITGAAATNPRVVAFLAFTSKEAQLAYLVSELLAAQVAYTATNPASTLNRVSIVEGIRDAVFGVALPISGTAVSDTLLNAVQPTEFGAVKLTDPAATGDVAALLALPTLEKQITSLAVTLQNEEFAYNTANPAAQFNRVTFAPDYDDLFVGITATLPLATSATSRPVLAYLP